MDFYDEIYSALIGELNADAALPWIENAFAPGSECDLAYSRMAEARNRVLDKLGTGDDPDLNQMLTEMESIQHILCRKVVEMRRM